LQVGKTDRTDSYLSLVTSTSGIGGILFADSTGTGDGGYRGQVGYHHSDDSMRFSTAASERMRILSGGGLTFNGDSAQANALDDYEEGSWTPTVLSGTISGSGTYTKIGNIVKIEAKLTSFTDRSTSNAVSVSSLPFTPADNQACGSAFGRYLTGEPTAIYADSNKLLFYSSSSGGYDSLLHNELNNSNAEIYFSAVYRVA
jgi:hypothetical protein